jgi:prepilin-type N-terminal cleavage/methylation domain-containing protein
MTVRRQRGISLVEIMIAVAILAIVATIAIPIYEGYILEARYGTALKDIRQIELILDDLAADSDLGSVEPGSYAGGADLGVYTNDTGIQLGSLTVTPANTQPWLDPWGNRYRYQRASINTNVYVLFSQGPDTSDASDDVSK